MTQSILPCPTLQRDTFPSRDVPVRELESVARRVEDIRERRLSLLGLVDKMIAMEGVDVTLQDKERLETFLADRSQEGEARAWLAIKQTWAILYLFVHAESRLILTIYPLCPLIEKLVDIKECILKVHPDTSIPLPSEIVRFKQLQRLQVNHSLLKALPSTIKGLCNLTELDVSHNLLRTLPRAIGELRHLRNADASHNLLEKLPSKIKHLRLKELNVGHNRFIRFPSKVLSIKTLVSLSLNNNQLRILPVRIVELKQLRYLDVSCNLLRALPSKLRSLTLDSLYVDENPFDTPPRDAMTMHISAHLGLGNTGLRIVSPNTDTLTSLEVLDMCGNLLRTIPPSIGDLHQLTILDLSNNKLYELPSSIGDLCSLTMLMLKSNELYILPLSTGKIHRLKILDVSYNRLEALPPTIEDLDELTFVDVSHNLLEGSLVKIMHLLRKCRHDRVNLNDNSFNTPLPSILEVELSHVNRDPLGMLTKLRPHLNMRTLPKIRYKDSPAYSKDVTRDFVTHLFLAMFPEESDDLPFSRCDPEVRQRHWMVIGQLFGAAFLDESEITMSGKFHPSLFDMIGTLNGKQMKKIGDPYESIDYEIIDRLLPAYMGEAVRDAHPETVVMRQQLTSSLLGGGPDKTLDVPADVKELCGYEREEAVTKKRCLDELDNGRFMKLLPIVCAIAKGMYDYVGEEHWIRVRYQAKMGILRTELEGIVFKEDVVEKLDTNLPESRAYRYLVKWVRESDNRKLRDFLLCVTGSGTLPPFRTYLRVTIRDEERFPSFRIRARQICLPNYGENEGYRYFADALDSAIAYVRPRW
ncbi:MAG: hypothetical protein OXF02_04935 [Simkaniaceae bacterium]|nr:hypothetical protein [Simkaniaceae bacterium]